ncbi:MAG: fumarylacetoacetate hydrolase [Variovorax sp.]|nr:MAG: fumarylacetoacetate hydrolase [Variovorax sp.]
MPMKKTLVVVALGTALGASFGLAQAACLSDSEVADMANAMAARTPAVNPPEGMNEADASCTRAKLNKLLAAKHGAVIGYKAGLTNPAVQKRFNYDKPVWGVLYQGMVLDSGAVVDAAFGARPLFEADMLVRVKSADIHKAKTPAEVLANIDQVIPFIELPDLAVQAPPKLNGPGVAAINVGARLGVKGVPIDVPATSEGQAAMLESLKAMTVVVSDGKDNAELARGKGSDILEHPLNAVVWLADALGKEGIAMKAGDLISLGSFSPLMPPKPGLTAMVRYEGLSRAQPVVVTFK